MVCFRDVRTRQSADPDPQDFFADVDGRGSCSVAKFADAD